MSLWFWEKIINSTGFIEKAFAAHGGGSTFQLQLDNPLLCPDFGCVANKIIDGLFTLSIPIVSVMVLVGGFQILFATGNPEKLKTGKQTIIYSVVGFAVILLAKSVVLIIQDFFR